VAWEFVRHASSTAVVKTRQGMFRVRSANMIIARHIYVRREFESALIPVVIAALREEGFTPERATVVDIGANLGMTSISLMTGGYASGAIAIEPEPNNFADLVANVALNGLEGRITCHQFAASDRVGTLEMELSRTNFGDHRVRVSSADTGAPNASAGTSQFGEAMRAMVHVPAAPLDHFLQQLTLQETAGIGYVWMDVQGYDAAVIRGAGDLIARGVPICTEFWPYAILRAGETADSYCDLMESRFRHVLVIHDNQLKPPMPISGLRALFHRLVPTTNDRTIVLVP
jgi:FkbM family methyltransferase